MAEFDYTGLDLVEVPEGAADDLRAMREAAYGAAYPYDAAAARAEASTLDLSGLDVIDTDPAAPAVDWDAEKSWARQFNPVYRPDGTPFPSEKAALEARSGLGIDDARILPLSEGGYHLVRAPATDEDRARLERLNAALGREGDREDETTTLGEVGEIPAGVAAGAVGTAGTALQGVSAAFPPARDDIPEERKEALRTKMREAEAALMKGDVEAYSRLTREIHREALVPVTQRAGFEAGQRIRDWGQRTFPASEGYEDSFGRMVGEGVGSLATGIAASVVHPGAAMVLFTTLGMGEAADRAAQSLSEKHGSEAVDRGDYDEEITRAAILGVGPGMTDQIPVEVLLNRLPVPGAKAVGQAIRSFGGERVMRAIGRIGAQGVLEAVQEGGQQALQNLIARHVHSPETTVGEGILPAAGVGGVVGTIAGVGREAVLNLAGRRSRSARGVRAQAAENVPSPTAEDEASPIPTETIVEGRKVVADAEGKKVANRILSAEGMPAIGTPVRIAIGRKGYEGVVTDAWGEGPEAGITVTEADGSVIDATLQELHAFGAELEVLSDAYVEGEPEAVPPEIADQDRHVSEIAAAARSADVETTAGTEADTGGWTPPANLPSLSPSQAEAVTELVKGGMDADRAVAVAAAMPRGDVETEAGAEADTGTWTPPGTEAAPETAPAAPETAPDTAETAPQPAPAYPEADVDTTAPVETESVPRPAADAPAAAEDTGGAPAFRPPRAPPTPSPEAMPEGDVDDMAPVESDLEIVEMAPEGGAAPEEAAPDVALPEREATPDAMQPGDVETEAPVESVEPEGLTGMQSLAWRQARNRVADMAPDEARQYLDNLAAAGQRVDGIEIPGEVARPEPSPDAMVDRTVETEAPVETRPRILLKLNGEPFKSPGAARLAADRREMLDPEEYRIVEVEGGYGIEHGVEVVEPGASVTASEQEDRRPSAPAGEAVGISGQETAGPARPEPGPEAMVDATVETVAPVETEDRGPRPELVFRKDGQPFKTARAAEFAARAKKLEGYMPVEVEGGFAIEVPAAQGEQDGQEPGPVAAGRAEGVDVPPGEPGVRPVDQGRAPDEPVQPDQEPGAGTEIPAGAPVEGTPGVEPASGVAPPPNQVPGSVPSRPVREVDRPARVITPAGRRVDVQPMVVEARDLIASHDETGRENPTFPSEFQPRDRSRAASQEQIASMAGDLIPELLMPSAQSAEGAPVVGPDRVVESGNARTLAIRRAYDMGMAGDYRQHLVERGYDIEGFDRPVLVQSRITSMTPEERSEFAREANARTTADRGASEVAASDAASVTRDMLDLYQPGDIGSAGNREFVRAFVGGVVPDMERAGMMAADGTLSQAGKQRIENALFDKAYGDAELLGALREDLDSNVKSLGGAMLDAAPEWARMRLAVAEGSADPVVDHTDHIIAAVRMVRKARNERAKLSELVAQDEMFSGDAMHPLAEQWLRMMHADRQEITGQVGRPKLAAALDFWAQEGQKKLPGGNMFGETVDSAEISRMMKTAREKMAVKRDEQTDAEAQADLLRGAPAQGLGPDGQGDGPGAAGPEAAAQAGEGRERGDREGERGDRSGLAEPGLADDFEPRQLALFADGGPGAVPDRPAGAAAPAEPSRELRGIAKTDVLALEDVRTGLTHVRSAEDAAHVAAPFRKEPQETLVAVVLGDNDRLVGTLRHSIGTANNVTLDAPLFVGSVSQVPGAKAFYIAHQHPSGKLELSGPDRTVGSTLSELLRNTDLNYRGSVVVAPGGRYAVFDPPDSADASTGEAIRVKPAPRRSAVPVYRRRWTKIPPQKARTRVATSAGLEKIAPEFLPELSGLMLFDNNLNLAGVMAMSTAEMSRLRGEGGAARDVLEAMAETNATRVAILARSTGGSSGAALKAIRNMRRFSDTLSRVGGSGADIDAILFDAEGKVLMHDRDELSKGTFLQRADRGSMAKPPLDPDRRMAVTEAASRYADLKPSTARTRARLDANREIQGKSFVNEDTGWPIEVTKLGIRESLAGDQTAVRAEIVANLPGLIGNAVRMETHPDAKGRREIADIHRFYVPLRLDGRLNRVKLTVRGYTDGRRKHYAVEFAEIAEPDVYTAPRTTSAGQSPEAELGPTGTAEPVVRLRPFLSGVKYDDGSDPRWTDDAEEGAGAGPLARALPEGSATSLEGDPDTDGSFAPPDDEIKFQRPAAPATPEDFAIAAEAQLQRRAPRDDLTADLFGTELKSQRPIDEGLFSRGVPKPEFTEQDEAPPPREKPKRETAGGEFDLFSTTPPPRQKPVTPSKAIEDFGEKIEGARKDLAAAVRERLTRAAEIDIAEAPLSESFPQIDYAKMVEAGGDRRRLALYAVLRSHIPNKPRRSYKLRRWVNDVEVVRGHAQRIMDETEDFASLEASVGETPATTAELIADLDPALWPKAAQYRFASGDFNYVGGENFPGGRTFYYLTRKGRTYPDVMSEDRATAMERARGAIEQELGEEAARPKGRSKYTKINVYQDRQTKDIFLGFKGNRQVVRLKTGFQNASAAREYLETNRDDLQAKIDEIRKGPSMRRDANRDREGKPRREGDVTPQLFSDTFGFRGVQFGNYVEGGRRQRDLNDSFDALMDLADAVNVPPKALALDGTLGLAFGARGRGGRAAAHYEPTEVVINLTKTAGPGSLAHEWLHALDANFGTRAGGQFLTDVARPGEGMRPEVTEAWRGVTEAIGRSDFATRARGFDAARSKPYWSQPIEMAARAFERYVHDRLAFAGFENDYLVNIDLTGGAYPTAEEMQSDGIAQAFDRLFDAVEHRETPRGVELFQRGRAEASQPDARVRIRPTRRFDAERLAIRAEIEAAGVRAFGKGFDVRLADRILTPEGEPATGAFDPAARIAYISLRDPADMTGTLHHEGLHYLRRAGAFTRQDGKPTASWKVLEAEAPRWREKYKIDERYPAGLGEDLLNEEAIAEAIDDYAKNRPDDVTGKVKLAMDRILAFWKRLGNAIRGRGFQTWTDVFEGVSAGDFVGPDGRPDAEAMDRYLQVAWHASPHRFDRFSTENIGTGEGAQAYGWGLYFAQKKGVAEWYRKHFEGRADTGRTVAFNGKKYGSVDDPVAIRTALKDIGVDDMNAWEIAKRINPKRDYWSQDIVSAAQGNRSDVKDRAAREVFGTEFDRVLSDFRALNGGQGGPVQDMNERLSEHVRLLAEERQRDETGESVAQGAEVRAVLAEELAKLPLSSEGRAAILAMSRWDEDTLDQAARVNEVAWYNWSMQDIFHNAYHEMIGDPRVAEDPRVQAAEDAADKVVGTDRSYTESPPLYRVDLAPKENQYLQWDRPINRQSAPVKEFTRHFYADRAKKLYGLDHPRGAETLEAYQQHWLPLPEAFFVFKKVGDDSLQWAVMPHQAHQGDIDWWLANEGSEGSFRRMMDAFDDAVREANGRDSLTGEKLYEDVRQAFGSPREASLYMLRNGVRGIKYLDQSSRPMPGALGRTRIPLRETHNYVIFDDSDVAIEEVLFQTAWHGSPHRFDQFSTARIGSGEGNQVYGWGLYFAEKKDVAEYYRKSLREMDSLSGLSAREQSEMDLPARARLIEIAQLPDFSPEQRLGQAERLLAETKADFARRARRRDYPWWTTSFEEYERKHKAAVAGIERLIETGNWSLAPRTDRLYRVDLAPAEDEYLLWDAPFDKQSETVQAALRSLAASPRTVGGLLRQMAGDPGQGRRLGEAIEKNETGRDLYRSFEPLMQSPQRAAQKSSMGMLAGGIRGIKYRDGMTRGRDGEGFYNYVIFDDADVTIEEAMLQRRRLGEFNTEPGAEGVDQAIIPGAEPLTERQVLERRMRGPATTEREQKAMDEGLWAPPEEEQLSLLQRIPAENREAFEEAASQQFGIDMDGAAAAVENRKSSLHRWGEELGDQLLGPTRKGKAEGIAVIAPEDPKDLNMLLRWLAPPGVWAKKYPRIHKVWRQGVKAEVDQSVYIKRLNREWDAITKPLNKEEFEQLTGLMFLGDAEARAFTDAELDDFKVGDKVKAAYPKVRRFIDKLGRWTEQHERNMKLDLLKRRSALIRDMAGRRGMSREAFRELYRERAILKGHMRHGRGNPDKLAVDIKDADYRLHGEMLEDPEYRELAGEADSLEARLENTTVRRRSGYVPHKFFGNWEILWANERAAGWNTETGARGDAAEGEVAEGDASGAPVWKRVGGEDGFFPSRMAALKAAREFQKGQPDAKILVKPIQFNFPDSKATVLTQTAFDTLRGKVQQLLEVTGEDLDAVLEGVARPRNRRRFAGFEEYREGMPGFNKNLDRVIRAHIGETVRYTTLDKLKYDAITAMEKEGLQRARITQERPELQKAVENFLRDVNGQKQPVEQQVDTILNRDWASPLRVGLAAGGAAFLAAGGATTSIVAGGLIGSYIGYRVTRSLARGGDFPSRAVTAGMLSDMSHLKLGMVTNIMSAVVNLTQTGLNTYPVLGFRDTSAGIRRLSAAIASNARGRPNNDWKILVKNDVNPTFGFGEGTKNQFQKESSLSKLSMLAFTSAEGFNRSVAFLGAVNKAERQGKSWGQAVQEGKRVMERTQFHYGAGNKPELLRGNFLRVPLQFKNFIAQQMTFALGVRGKEIPRFLLAMFLVAGALGIPGLDALDWLMDIMFDWSPIAAIKEGALKLAAEGELEGGLGQLMARGVPGALGVDISGRTGMGEKFLPLQIRDFAGAWFSTVQNAARHAQERAGVIEQIRNLSPGLGNPLRALEAAGAGGQVSNPWKRGRPEMTYTPGEMITKAVGGRPTREAMEQDWRDIYRRRTERMREWNRRYVDRAVEAVQNNQRRRLMEIMREAAAAGSPITGSQLRSAMRGMMTERAERTLRTLPKSLRGEARELRRGLDRAAPR